MALARVPWRLICHHSTGHAFWNCRCVNALSLHVCQISMLHPCKKPLTTQSSALCLELRSKQQDWGTVSHPDSELQMGWDHVRLIHSVSLQQHLAHSCRSNICWMQLFWEHHKPHSNHTRESAFPGKLGVLTAKRPICLSLQKPLLY